MNLLLMLVNEIHDTTATARRRIACLRHGHTLIPCANDDAVCARCGRWFA